MTRSYGLRCKKCGVHIHLEDANVDSSKTITFYAPPLDPVTCPHFGHVDKYDSKDHEIK